ncbi:TolC family protein [Marinilabiliaceae bacterium JC017]|nr:TolC family protein [Marinilabiliaceae bacterium JC017]
MKRTIYIFTLFIGSTLFSEAQTVLNLQQCREIATQTNPTIKQREQQVGAAESAVSASKKDYYPQIDVNGDFKYLQEPITVEFNNQKFEGNNTQYSVNASLIQNIYSGGTVRKMHEMTDFQLNLAKNNKATIEDVVLYQTELYFWNAIYREELVKLADSYRGVIDNLVRVVKDKVEGELVNRSDLLLVEVRQNEAALVQMKFSDDHQISLMELKKVMGIPVDSFIKLDASLGNISTYSTVNPLESALESRPELASQKELINIRETKTALTGAKYMPSVYAGVVPVWGAPNTRLPGNDPMYNTTVVAGLSFPIVRWGKKRDEVNEQRYLKDAEAYQLEELVNQVTLEVKSAKYQLDEAINRVALTTQSLKKAEENLEMMTDRYIEGLTSILEVLDAQLYWQSAYRNMLDAQAYYQSSLSTYKKAVGEI